jgi:hypothetical protein
MDAMKWLSGLDRKLIITLAIAAVMVAIVMSLPEPAPWAVTQ